MDRRVEERRVREVMTRTPKTVGPKTDVRVLKAMFERYDFNAFPVVDDEQGLLGVATVTPDDGLATAIDLMVQSRMRSLPVVERRGRREVLVGIVSRHDVLSRLMLEGNGHD